MVKMALERYLGKKVLMTFNSMDVYIGRLEKLVQPEDGYCKPLIYRLTLKDGTVLKFRPCDVKKCAEVKERE